MDAIDYRKYLLTNICKARKEYFRIQTELKELENHLPFGTYLSTYTSNSSASKNDAYDLAPYIYQRLAHKEKLLPSGKENNQSLVGYHHLGRKHNNRFLKGAIALERMQIAKIKLETLARIREHLDELKLLHKDYERITKDRRETLTVIDFRFINDPLDIFLATH